MADAAPDLVIVGVQQFDGWEVVVLGVGESGKLDWLVVTRDYDTSFGVDGVAGIGCVPCTNPVLAVPLCLDISAIGAVSHGLQAF